jgi:hypothetical protein
LVAADVVDLPLSSEADPEDLIGEVRYSTADTEEDLDVEELEELVEEDQYSAELGAEELAALESEVDFDLGF